MTNFKEELRTIIDDAVKELLATVSNDFKRTNFTDLVRTTKEAVDRLGSRLVSKVVELTDELYNARRDRHSIVIRNYKSRKLMSELGELTLSRRLYYDKSLARYFFAVDELLEIEKYSRIEGGLKVKLITDAAQSSYGKASKRAANCVSRQSVSNLLQRIPNSNLDAQVNGFKNVDTLYIEADEDHIHLKNGKSAEVRLVYVYEGRREVNRGRTELINVKYFATVGSATQIWTAVSDYVDFQYGVYRKNIQISGDGAVWIKGGLAAFPGANFKIDKFHVYKNVTDACAGSKKLRKQIIEGIKNNDRNEVSKLFAQRWLKEKARSRGRARVSDCLVFLDNNFDEIDLAPAYSCSAEGHVSHILSERMSSRPMAWTVKGADKMARLRAYLFNGGDFRNLIFTNAESTKRNKRSYNAPCEDDTTTDHSIPTGHFILSDEIADEVAKILKGV